MESYLDTFKQYVPAEILAAFIAINSLVPYRSPMDVYLLIFAIFVLTVLFVVSAIFFNRFNSVFILIVTALTLPFWCFSISASRFEDYVDIQTWKVVISVALILISLTLTSLKIGHAPAKPGTDPEK
jgi:hypothetical protein